MNDLDTFRSETRAWLEANCPASMRTPGNEDETVWGGRREKFVQPDSRVWLTRMAEKGWTCPMWPKQYGGGGLSIDENRVLQQELARINARPALSSFGIWMLGPALLEFGNEEQKLEHLPKIVRGEIRWCQGYSEPGSGSDLAGLRTKAEDRAITTSSTARRSGRRTPTKRTGSSVSCARISMCPNTKASAFCCSTWSRPASARSRSR